MSLTELVSVAWPSPSVVCLILNRAEKRNALSTELLRALAAELAEATADERCRVIVIAARGTVFSAGADTREERHCAVGAPGSAEALLAKCMQTIETARQPVVARLHADAYGGAVALLASTDLVVASDTARLVMPETLLGLVPTLAAEPIIARLRPRDALEFLALSGAISATQAKEWGLVSRCCPPDELDAQLTNTVQGLLDRGPDALALSKRLVRQWTRERPSDGMDELIRLTAEVVSSDEAREGAVAALERRQPGWVRPGPSPAAIKYAVETRATQAATPTPHAR